MKPIRRILFIILFVIICILNIIFVIIVIPIKYIFTGNTDIYDIQENFFNKFDKMLDNLNPDITYKEDISCIKNYNEKNSENIEDDNNAI